MGMFLLMWLVALFTFLVGYTVGRSFGFSAGVRWCMDQDAERPKLNDERDAHASEP